MKNLILSVSILLIASLVQAQSPAARQENNVKISVGIEAGLNVTNVTYTEYRQKKLKQFDYKTGAKAGIAAKFSFKDRVNLGTGIYYSMKGFDNVASYTFPGIGVEYTANVRINYLELPVNLLIKIGKLRRWYAGAGGYIAHATTANKKSATGAYQEKFTFRRDEQYNPYRKLDGGAQALVGYALPKGLFVQAQISCGLVNIGSDAYSEVFRNYGTTVSAGWMIGLSKHEKK